MGSASTRSIKYFGQFEMMTAHCSSEPPAIVAMEMTYSGYLLVCNKASMKVELFDESFRQVSQIRLSSEPYGMVIVSQDEMLVSLPELHCLQRLKLETSQSLVLEEKIETKLHCSRLIKYNSCLIVSVHADNYISFSEMDLNGQERRCIRKEAVTVDGIFNRLGFMALSPDKTVLYITEMNSGCIAMSVITGEVLFTYKEPKTKFLFGVCTDSEGFVYISSADRDKILMIDSNGGKIRQFPTVKGMSPGYMTYCKAKKKLFVKTVYTNKILVYDLT